MRRVRVKVCGLTRRDDAVHAAEAGADLLGVILVPSSPRFMSQLRASEILEGIPCPSALVVADQDLVDTISAAERIGASVIQLHGTESPEAAGTLRSAGPWKVWKALRVRKAKEVQEALARFGPFVDGLLLDAWHPEKIGGTGSIFPWDSVAETRTDFPPDLELVVAGGLNPGNVVDAIEALRPDVVDVSSGVEKGPGLKDGGLVEDFIQNVRGAGMGGIE